MYELSIALNKNEPLDNTGLDPSDYYLRCMHKKWFTQKLLHWHETDNQRSMPWKGEQDPYKIWLSEIILQQTRVEQGTAYYEKFISHYPTVFELAKAPIDEVLKLWEGLGYYSRARNLHFTARMIQEQYDGIFPDTYKELLKLKGVGPYTASAIASFAFGLPHPVVDGNSLRLVSRFTGSERPIDQPSGKKWVQEFLEKRIPADSAAGFNQALMDFGATVCKPAKPDCQHCPLASRCIAFKEGMVEEIPMKAKKLKRVARVFHYLYAEQSAQVLIAKRDQKDIWQGLYELPMKESDAPKPLKVEEVKEVFLLPKGSEVRLLSKGKQRLTHQDLTAYFYTCSDLPQDWGHQHSGIWVDIKNLSTFGFPKLVRCFLEEKQLTLNI